MRRAGGRWALANFGAVADNKDGVSTQAGTSDGQTIKVEVTLYYKLKVEKLPQIYATFGVDCEST